jgi:hypothetical protein
VGSNTNKYTPQNEKSKLSERVLYEVNTLFTAIRDYEIYKNYMSAK